MLSALTDHGVIQAANMDPFTTLRHLTEADLLVTAKSSFSYVAALLNPGLVLYEPFWHGPIPGWIVLYPTGEVPAGELVPALVRLRGGLSL